ncbi:MAG TPA: hypothetical protein VJX66_20010 [Amycolatopsis sp.]|nr:hypothetical protein [Amycolatopsis sp.]
MTPSTTARGAAGARITPEAPATGRSDPKPKAIAPKRINVAVNPETVEALQRVIDREGVTLTEAVRRLIGYGEVLYRAAKEDGAELLIKTETETRQVIIL